MGLRSIETLHYWIKIRGWDGSPPIKMAHGSQITPRLVRLALKLFEFNFKIRYKKRKKNSNADGLSKLNLILENYT